MIRLILLGLLILVAFFNYLFGWIILSIIFVILLIPLVIPNKYFLPKKKSRP